MERYFSINQSGCSIRCKLYCQEPRKIQKVVLFVHGFGGHKDAGAAARFAEKLLGKQKGAALVTFDLPAHGEDVHKKLSLEDCLDYMKLVTGYLQETYHAPIFCYATSFGGYLTLLYLAKAGNPFQKIALRCPAVEMYQSITGTILSPEQLVELNKGKALPVGFDRKVTITRAFLQELQENDIRPLDYLDWAEDICIVQGTADEILAPEKVFAFADDHLIESVPVEGADHRFHDPKKLDLAHKIILEFLFS